MNKLDEIALRVADEVFTGNCEDNSEILAFARALLAELSKDVEPVAWMADHTKAIVYHHAKVSAPITHQEFNKPLFTRPIPSIGNAEPVAVVFAKCDGETMITADLPLGTKLFTRPIPVNTAEIEQRVAELEAEFLAYKRATDMAYKGSELETLAKLTAEQHKVKVLTELVETANRGVIGAHSVMWQRKAKQALATVKGE